MWQFLQMARLRLTRASNLVAARLIHEEDPKVLSDPVATLQRLGPALLIQEMLVLGVATSGRVYHKVGK